MTSWIGDEDLSAVAWTAGCRRRLRPLVTDINLESEEVHIVDGVHEGVALGSVHG
jgi:hypothetical protein